MKTTILVSAGLVTVGTIAGLYLWTTRPQHLGPRKMTQAEITDRLKALPYARWHEAAADDSLGEGILVHDPLHAFRGASLYTLEDESVARLVDMNGTTLHAWQNKRTDWHHVEMDPDGSLFVVGEEALVKMDWDSRVLWKVDGAFHHDLSIGSDGMLYTLMSEPRFIEHRGTDLPIIDDLVVVMTPTGQIQDRISLWDIFQDSVDPQRLDRVARMLNAGQNAESALVRDACDVFHTNSIESLVSGVRGISNPGDLLICLREIDTVAIVGLENRRVLWSWGPGQLMRQHHPSLLENGNILIFDNRERVDGSRVIELNPHTAQIEWEYRSEKPGDFWSQRRGACQRLPNGNTLITDSDNGRVFEVTRAGTVTWELRSRVRKVHPLRVEREAIYRAARFEPSILRDLPFSESIRARLEQEGYFAATPSASVEGASSLRLPPESHEKPALLSRSE